MEGSRDSKELFVNGDHDDLCFGCPGCPEKFHSQEKVDSQIPIHNLPQSSCSECDLTFESQESFESHMIYHNIRPYQCEICKNCFKRKTHLDRHREIHTKDTIEHICAVCLETCCDQDDLHNHLQSHLNTSCKKCEQCNLKFESEVEFKTHLKKHDTRPHDCNECGKAFKHRHHLDRHIKEIHTDKVSDRPFKCSLCVSMFVRKVQLDHHLNTHGNSDLKTPFQCDVCNACYLTKHHLRRHMKFHMLLNIGDKNDSTEKAENCGPCSCKTCDAKFKTKYHLYRHVKIHHVLEDIEQNGTQCAICEEFFYDKMQFVNHMRVHMKDCHGTDNRTEAGIENAEDLTGEACILQSDSNEDSNIDSEEYKPKIEIDDLHDETSSVNNIADSPEYLNIADLQTNEVVKMEPNLNITGEKQEDNDMEKKEMFEQSSNSDPQPLRVASALQFVCDTCYEPFGKKSALVNHKKTHEGYKEDVGFKCEVCEKSFQTRRKLKVHVRTHNQRKFICEICNKEFRTRQNLDLHAKIHYAIKDFVCPMCQKAFRTKQHLLVHGKVHLKEKLKKENSESDLETSKTLIDIKTEDKEKPDEKEQLTSMMIDVANKYLTETFQCEFCGKNFSTKQNMQLHLKIHLDIKDFVCEICDKGFRTKQQLKVHQNKHKEKITSDCLQFMCDYCKKVFSTKQNLGLHLKIHMDVRDFVCVVCNKGFRTKQQLKNHENVHKTLNKLKKKEKGNSEEKEGSSVNEDTAEDSHKAIDVTEGKSKEKEGVEEFLMEISNIEQMLECRIDTDNNESRENVSMVTPS